VDGFTKRYSVERLVYFEHTTDVNAAIARETEIKRWSRKKKVALIEQSNAAWRDLAEELRLLDDAGPESEYGVISTNHEPRTVDSSVGATGLREGRDSVAPPSE
jgi:hypothetical protein